MVRQFSENAQRCIFDKRGGLVPVGVTGWVADTSGLLGSPAKWDEQGRLVRLNDDLHRVQANIDQETLPPAMPEKHPDFPVGRVQIEPSMDPAELAAFCDAKNISLLTLLSVAFGYTLAIYANAEEALFSLLFNTQSEGGPKLLKTASVSLPMESGKSTEELLQAVHGQLLSCVESNGLLCEACREDDPRRGAMIACLKKGQTDDFDAVLTSGRAGLIVTAFVSDGGLTLRGSYSTEVFCRSFIEGFLKCCARVLSEMTRREKLEEISFLGQAAFEPYDRINQTFVPVEIVSVNRLFERQAQLNPDKTAVIVAGEALTFDQLNRLANRAARGLRVLGVGKDSIIGMVLDRTKEIFIAEHAILKAGGAFLPLVPEYPDERIQYCLEDAESPCVITTEAIKADRPALFSRIGACKVLTVEALIQNDGEENLDLDIAPDSLAYCIYTSGSTGKPKGVMIEHRNMCNYLNANPMHPAIYWHTQDIRTALSVTSISFDMSINLRFLLVCHLCAPRQLHLQGPPNLHLGTRYRKSRIIFIQEIANHILS